MRSLKALLTVFGLALGFVTTVVLAFLSDATSRSTVNGHREVPVGGHENCPWVVIRTAQWRT